MFSKQLYRKVYKWRFILAYIFLALCVIGCFATPFIIKYSGIVKMNNYTWFFVSGFILLAIVTPFVNIIEGILLEGLERSYVSKHQDGSITYKKVVTADSIKMEYITYYSNRIDSVVKKRSYYQFKGSFSYEENYLSCKSESGFVNKLKIPAIFENMEELLKCAE